MPMYMLGGRVERKERRGLDGHVDNRRAHRAQGGKAR